MGKGSKGAAEGPDVAARIQAIHRAHAEAAEAFFAHGAHAVAEVARVFVAALGDGKSLLFFGNGGSAADAQHLAAEFVNRFARDRPGLAALALTTDTSVLTSIGNDQEFSRIFARQVEALGRAGDVAIGLTTSGRSANVLEGLRAARRKELVTVGLTGADPGPMRETARVQEVHILVGHVLCQLVDDALYPPR
jgi:D-sedoheptulose 7-phosphate isomerase